MFLIILRICCWVFFEIGLFLCKVLDMVMWEILVVLVMFCIVIGFGVLLFFVNVSF